MELQDQWWASNRDEFHLAFEETTPDQWAEVLRVKRARMEAWLADQIRERMYTTKDLPRGLVA
jgi:hypothetical protein